MAATLEGVFYKAVTSGHRAVAVSAGPSGLHGIGLQNPR